MNDKVILDLCGGTGAWSKPYEDAGYDVRVLTLPDHDVTRWREYPDIVELIESGGVYGILAAPPCTMFSIARANPNFSKRDLRGGMKTVNSCLEIVHECLYAGYQYGGTGLKFWALENPHSGYLKRFLGLPALVFDPCDYGDPYTKKTAIWGEFCMPIKSPTMPIVFDNLVEKGQADFTSSVEHFEHLKKIPDGYAEKTGYSKRKIMRSITPQGFAKAFCKANR